MRPLRVVFSMSPGFKSRRFRGSTVFLSVAGMRVGLSDAMTSVLGSGTAAMLSPEVVGFGISVTDFLWWTGELANFLFGVSIGC